jgi:hypothetical protein
MMLTQMLTRPIAHKPEVSTIWVRLREAWIHNKMAGTGCESALVQRRAWQRPLDLSPTLGQHLLQRLRRRGRRPCMYVFPIGM